MEKSEGFKEKLKGTGERFTRALLVSKEALLAYQQRSFVKMISIEREVVVICDEAILKLQTMKKAALNNPDKSYDLRWEIALYNDKIHKWERKKERAAMAIAKWQSQLSIPS